MYQAQESELDSSGGSGDAIDSGGSSGGRGSGNAGLVMQGIGGGFSGIGSIIQGNMQGDALDFQAGVNATNAQEAREQGAYNASRSQLLANKRIGAMRAGYGAAGISANSASASAVLMSSAANAELDRLNILHQADIKAVNFDNQAMLDRQGAENSRKGGYLGGVAGLVTAGATIAMLV